MPSKPNYNFQRSERDRAKQAKKEEKLMAKKDLAAQRKTAQTGDSAAPDSGKETGE
jgi:hypothetical protein